jgi:chemotaxis protein histidine kinase CheA
MTDKNQPPLSQTLQLLEQLKEIFLAELPDQCQELSTLILTLDKQPESHDIYEELYRAVHSLKGSAGTYGLHIISQICHHFEDLLSTLDDESTKIDAAFIHNCLTYADLIQEAIAAHINFLQTTQQ